MKFACECGEVRGYIDVPPVAHLRMVCTCASCQSYAANLGCADAELDGNGGTDIIQLDRTSFHLTDGLDRLASLKLTKIGPERVYAACCQRPVFNILANRELPVVGFITRRLLADSDAVTRNFGPVAFRVFRKAAIGHVARGARGTLRHTLAFLGVMKKSKAVRISEGSQWDQLPFDPPDPRQ